MPGEQELGMVQKTGRHWCWTAADWKSGLMNACLQLLQRERIEKRLDGHILARMEDNLEWPANVCRWAAARRSGARPPKHVAV